MALFSKKEKTEKKVSKTTKKPVEKKAETKKTAEIKSTVARNLSNIILEPRITEKAAVKADLSNSYTFNINPQATKKDVVEAVEMIYKVVPIKVNITKIPKKVVRRRHTGVKGGGKKAVVFLKKGDKIEFV
jgi:large subunit ribosomal protein L23